MNKIANWVFGSFFRTIGRLLVFILLGVIIAHFIDFGSLKDNFSITDLFFDKVKADTFSAYFLNDCQSCTNNGGYFGKSVSDTAGTLTSKRQDLLFTSANDIKTQIGLGATSILVNTFYYSNSSGMYNNYTSTDNGQTYPADISYTVYALFGTENSTSYSLTQMCWSEQDTNSYKTIQCPIYASYSKLYGFQIVYHNTNYFGTQNINFFFGYNRNMNLVYDTQNQMNNAINQQTQQQQQQHQETMNSTTTEAESEATSFFGDFEDQDFGGLSAIVTAPLNTIRSLLSSTCTNLVLPLPFVNKNLTLPCMNSIYTEHFGLFFTLYQTIILAIISYRCIRSIFYDIHGFTNPDDDRIEVMDL